MHNVAITSQGYILVQPPTTPDSLSPADFSLVFSAHEFLRSFVADRFD